MSAEPAAATATDVATETAPAPAVEDTPGTPPAFGSGDAPEAASDGSPEATPDAAPEATSGADSNGAPETPSGAESEGTSAAASGSAPEATPDAAPEATANGTPGAATDGASVATSDAEGTSAAASDTEPEATPGAAAEATANGTSETASATASNGASEAAADGASVGAVEAPSGSAPAAAANGSLEATSGAATPAAPVPTPAAPVEPSVVAQHAPVPPPTAAMPHTQPATAVPAAPVAGTPVPEASANPGRWGRVDADGTVYVKTADGERAVGSWHAGEPAEGLAHYARRFDDVRTEVELLVARLSAGSGDPKHTMTNAKHIKESLTDAALVGDLAALAARIDNVLERAQEAVESVRHARDEARGQALARKQELVAEVEKIAESSTQWKSAGDRLRAILDEWKTIKGVDRKTDDQLWKRFSKARDTFNRRRGAHFADLDRQRGAAKERKQELVKLAEEISESDDWGPTAARYRDLMTEWKAAGRAPKEADDALWQQFRAAQDKFFSRRSAVFNERDAELVENAKRKEALIAEAEKINPASDLEAARAQLHRIQEKWDEVGKVPRERIRELEGKLRAVEDKVRNAGDAQWRRTDPEAEARAAQFRERVEQFEAQAAKARAAGDKRRAEQAEAQAAQWREWLAAAENAVASR